ncbi:MarR family winged helix-turn-helix transcriptional regulator [Sphingobium sp. LB126]|uniref:MarR family winged helix-turn-helix transcriptional regulator n=1 Tax=Sphingobium sp. LB126 TaxID=1983755 RepID=UPI0012FE274E|nr:MarR family winged helix-turn-helix transcriptional regulator [Sphingobium sp. LB126]
MGEALGFSVCANPIWDMLLDLYLARFELREVYLWPLCIASHCPLSTAHRKVLFMERCGLVVRSKIGRDRRRINVAMTDRGGELMDGILDRMTDRVYDRCPHQPV